MERGVIMKWTCCKCEHKYEHEVTGDAEERMCFSCLDGVKEEFGDNDCVMYRCDCKKGEEDE